LSQLYADDNVVQTIKRDNSITH